MKTLKVFTLVLVLILMKFTVRASEKLYPSPKAPGAKLEYPSCVSLAAWLGFHYSEGFDISIAGGSPMIKINHFISPQLELETHLLTDFKYIYYHAFGPKYHFLPIGSGKCITPYIGLLMGSENGLGFVELPVGFNFIYNKRINASIGLMTYSYMYDIPRLFEPTWNNKFPWDVFLGIFELTIGWRF